MSLLFATIVSVGHAARGGTPMLFEDAVTRQQDDEPRRIPFAEMQKLFDGAPSKSLEPADVEMEKYSETGSNRRRTSDVPTPIQNVGDIQDVVFEGQYFLDLERDEAEGCYDADYSPVENCSCHESCQACGFSDEPVGQGECVLCPAGSELVSSWPGDVRGECVLEANTPTCVGYEVPAFHWGEMTPHEYCLMGGAGYNPGSHCARAWMIATGEEIPCDVSHYTPCCFPLVQICCIQPDIFVYPAIPAFANKKKVCEPAGRIKKISNDGTTKEECQSECYADEACKFYALSANGGCGIYHTCSKRRRSPVRWMIYQKTLKVLIPTSGPTEDPTPAPTKQPTPAPTDAPTEPTYAPTEFVHEGDEERNIMDGLGGDDVMMGGEGNDEFHTGEGFDTVYAQGAKLTVIAEDDALEIEVRYDSVGAPRYVYWDAQAGEIVIRSEPHNA